MATFGAELMATFGVKLLAGIGLMIIFLYVFGLEE